MKRYFSSPEFYERDRDLFKRYIPVLRRITEAGWEPVTYATTSDPKVWIERFGYWEKGNLHFTIRNSTPEERKVTVRVQLAKLAGSRMPHIKKVVVADMVEGQRLPLTQSERKGEVGFVLNMKGYETRVVAVRGGLAVRK